jgi:hypothetical protein
MKDELTRHSRIYLHRDSAACQTNTRLRQLRDVEQQQPSTRTQQHFETAVR